MNTKILIVDDDPDILQIASIHLKRAGYETLSATTGEEALLIIDEKSPDLVLLDIMLPDITGTELCRKIRQKTNLNNLPIIFLSAKAEEFDRILGFELGADDYIVKTAGMREMVLRVQAVLRRSKPIEQPSTSSKTENPLDKYRFEELYVDIKAHRVWVSSTELFITALEFKLLSTLMERKGIVQTRESLLADVWGIKADLTTRTVDTHVKRLREKLQSAGRYVETVRGVGYRFIDNTNN